MRWRGVIAASVMAAVLGAAAGASACIVPAGFTWYADGTYQKSGPAGSVVNAYATLVRPNQVFYLVSAGPPRREDEIPCAQGFERMNPNGRLSNSSGLIGLTAGRINRGAGTWEICFMEVDGRTSTIPVLFTVV